MAAEHRALVEERQDSGSEVSGEPPRVTTAESRLPAGFMVDHFRVMRPLGQGGMGEVYLARDTSLGRRVALKLVRGDIANDETLRGRFLFEARATAKFNHPHIVTIYAVGEHEVGLYVALEYLEGDTLKARMRRGALTTGEALRLAKAIADALVEAHGHGILHRDLKPANVMIGADGRPRVLDFGLAVRLRHDEAPPSSRAGTEVESGPAGGTPAYMSPEQWRDSPSTEATDVFSLGVVLFEMLTGQRPFLAERLDELAKLVCEGPRPRLADHGAFPEALCRLLDRCLERDAAARPTAADLAETLDGLIHPERATIGEEGPFRGLLPFDEAHAGLFHGRDDEVASLRERLRQEPVLPVVGPSGAGKSSLVLAGLVPRWRETGPLTVLALRPGNTPLVALAQRLVYAADDAETSAPLRADATLPKTQNWERVSGLAASLRDHPRQLAMALRALAMSRRSQVVLIVDQLEELVTLVDDPDERDAFMRAICTAADDASDPVRVVMTLRHDFLDRLVTTHEARQVFSRVAVVQRPSDEMLERTLVAPLAAAGYRFEEGVAPRMVAEVAGEPACLPLLQFAAQSLWARRDQEDKRITKASYDAIGGVAGALATHADGVLGAMTEDDAELARELLLRLVTPERTRRAVAEADAIRELGERGTAVLAELVKSRLVHVIKRQRRTGTETLVELTHESLVTTWDSLARWLDESREELAFVRQMEQAAELWKARGRRPEELWQGDALGEASARLDRLATVAPALVREFVDAASAQAGRHARRRRAALIALLLSLAAVAGFFAYQNVEASRLRNEALAEKTRAEASHAEALVEAARAAQAQDHMVEARSKLRLSLQERDSSLARGLWWQLEGAPLLWRSTVGGATYAVAFADDGEEIAVACQDQVAYLFDPRTATGRQLHGHVDQVVDLAYSPNGERLATVDWKGKVMIWPRGATTPALTFQAVKRSGVRGLAWKGNDEVLVVGGEGKLAQWRLDGPEELRTIQLARGLLKVVHDPKHGTAVVKDDQAILVDLAAGRALRSVALPPHALGLAWLADGRLLVATGAGPMVVENGSPTAITRDRHPSRAVAVSRDGALLASAGTDGTTRIYETASGKLLDELRGHRGRVTSVAFGPSGQRLVTGGGGHRINLWRRGQVLTVASGHRGMTTAVAISDDGETVVSGGVDETLRVWDAASGEQRAVREDDTDVARMLRIQSGEDGRPLLLAAEQDGTFRMRDLATLATLQTFRGASPSNADIVLSQKRNALLGLGADGVLSIWDLATETMRSVEALPMGVRLTLSADEAQVAVAGSAVALVDLDRMEVTRTLDVDARLMKDALFAGDGVVTIDNDGRLLRHDPASGTHRELYRQPARLHRILALPEGGYVMTGAGGFLTWVSSEGKVLRRVRGHGSEANGLAIDAAGKRLASVGDDGTVRLWSLKDGRRLWRGPLLATAPPRAVTHRGWVRIDDAGALPTPDAPWAAPLAHAFLARRRGERLCIAEGGGAVSSWRGDEREHHWTAMAPDQLEALPAGCLALSEGRAWLLTAAEPRPLGGDGQRRASAVSVDPVAEEIVVATGAALARFSLDGAPRRESPGGRGVSAVLNAEAWSAIGYRNGTVVVKQGSGESELDQTVGAAVSRLAEGPSDTLLVGFEDGSFGLWDRVSGEPMRRAKLHGPVHHLAVDGGRAYALTALGQHAAWDLGIFDEDYCALMRRVWAAIPTTWRGGRPVIEAPPSNHRCR